MANTAKVRKFWGWGYEGEGPSRDQQEQMAKTLAAMFDLDDIAVTDPPTIDELELPEPRLAPPASLASQCTTDPAERAGHTYGKSFRDVVRALPPRVRAPARRRGHPAHRGRRRRVLDWCADAGVAAIPYGGGSSVVGGVECDVGDTYRGAVSIDLRHLDQVLEIDRASRAARIQAGVYGPALEDQLRPHGLTLRHFPQSFEFSTLGGWIATRSGGHYATLYTHIDDFVESMRVVTPRGVVESRRLPGSGAGPSPDRLFLGSEGILGVITEAWMRLQDRPRFRASATARFPSFEQGVQAARALAQSGLHPSNCRLLDATEAMVTGTDDGSAHLLLIAFESADHPLDAWIARAVELRARPRWRGAGRRAPHAEPTTSTREGAAGAWRNAFLRAPVHTGRARGHGHGQRDVRDREHLGPLRRAPRRRHGRSARRARRDRRAEGRRHVPVHARVPRRARAVLHRASRPGGPVRSSSSGRRSRPRRPTRSCATAARSPTTTPSAATTGRGTTGSARRLFAEALRVGQARTLDPPPDP